MTTYYVNNVVGDNANPGTQAQPWETIRYAVTQVVANDRIRVVNAGANYTNGFSTTINGSSGNEIKLRADDRDDPPIIANTANWNLNADYWEINGFIFDSNTTQAIKIGEAGPATSVVVRNCHFRHSTKLAVRFNETIDCVLEDCWISDIRSRSAGADQNSVNFQNGDSIRPIIRRCVFEDIGSDGIQVFPTTFHAIEDALIEDCVFFVNRPYGTSTRYWQSFSTNVSENAVDFKGVFGGNNSALMQRCLAFGFQATVAGQDASGSDGQGIFVHHRSDSVTIDQCRVYDCKTGIGITKGSPYASCGGTVLNTIIHDCTDEGIYCYDGTEGLTIDQCSIIDCVEYLDIQDSDIVSVKNNYVEAGVFTRSGNTNEGNFDYNGWYNLGTGPPAQWVGANDPTITTPSLNTFSHPEAGSDLLGVGDNLGYSEDQREKPRGATPSVGAYEQADTGTVILDLQASSLLAWSDVDNDPDHEIFLTPSDIVDGLFRYTVYIKDTVDHTLQYTLSNEKQMHLSFYLEPSRLAMANDDRFTIIEFSDGGTTAATIDLRYFNGYYIAATIRDDATGTHHVGSSNGFALGDNNRHLIESDIIFAASAGDNNGSMSLEIDGILQDTVSSINNDTLAPDAMDLGAQDVDAGTGTGENFDSVFFVDSLMISEADAPAPPVEEAKARLTPQASKMYLVVQQPEWRTAAGVWTGYDWSGTVSAAPGTTNDEISVTSDDGVTLLDGMTVLIDSSEVGGRDRGTFKVHGDQTIGAGAETLYIHNSGELGNVQIGDKVVALDEFRYWPRYPKTTESSGTLTWYKDWGYFRDSLGADGYLWSQLGGAAATRREAAIPPTAIMGPHRVQFIDPDVGSVDVDFDWSDSYTLSPGATVNAWASAGEDGGAGWTSALENPAAQTYSNLSGQAGYRTTLSVLSDVTDPIIEFRRGVRYVFTLRRPDQYQDGTDPTPKSHYIPITDFEVSTISGDFAQGAWATSVRIFGPTASEYEVQPGALAILFTDDWYAGEKESLGPLAGAQNILLIGHIADGTIIQDSETGDVTFDIISLAEQASRRENYPVPITNNDSATEWTDLQDLTVSRAAWWFAVWHSTLPAITDVFADIELDSVSDTREIAGQDFLAGDLFRASLDNFLQARVVGRVLMDRYERAAFVIDRQLQTVAGGEVSITLEDGDWIGQIQLREINEVPASVIEAGGVNYNAGTITPYLSIAPGDVSGYIGTNQASNNLAVTGQAQLNTISGRLYAYANNRYPELILQMAGNWRELDIWPQNYIVVTLETERFDLANEYFIARGISYEFDAAQGAIFTTYRCELESDGPDGVTVPILSELEPTTGNTDTPPEKPPGFGGVAMVATNDGIWITYNLLDTTPTWAELNDGLGASGTDARVVWSLVEDPNNPGEWWACTDDGLYYNDDLFGTGTWDQLLSLTDIGTIATVTAVSAMGIDFCALKPGYAAVIGLTNTTDLWVIDNNSNGASSTVGDWRGRGIGADTITGGQQIAVSDHLNVGGTDVRCVIIGIQDTGYLFIDDTGDTSGAWTNDVDPGAGVFPITFWESPTYDDDSGFLNKSSQDGVDMVQLTSAFLDLGPGTTTAKGDASMLWGTNVHGVILWADILNTNWYVAGEEYIWYSNDAGTNWSTWGNDYSGSLDDVGAADGDEERGFIIASVDSDEPSSDIKILYNPDDGAWDDKTGNVDDDSVATSGYRIYLLDV